MASIFTKIVNGEIPCYKIAENDDFLAFLDVNPLVAGHTLVIPKKEVDYIFNLDEETYTALWSFAKKVALAVDKAIPCKRVVVSVIGIEVPHTHIHLIPLNTIQDCNFSNPKIKLPEDEMKSIAAKIVSVYESL
jgi:histidine triad (HIT) family protein